MKKDKIFIGVVFIELLIIFVLIYNIGVKLKDQQETINNQNKKLKECSYEIKRLKLVEQNFEEEKEYLYECYKDIELKAERSGK